MRALPAVSRPARATGRRSRLAMAVVALVVAGWAAIVIAVVVTGPVPGAGAATPADVAQQAEPDGPSPVGRPLPPKSQRVADSAIAVVLLVTLGATLVAVATVPRWNRRRRDGAVGEAG